MTWTARRRAAAAGPAAVHGHLVGEERHAVVGGRLQLQDVAGLEREHRLDRQVHAGDLGPHRDLDAADRARRTDSAASPLVDLGAARRGR